MAIVKQTPSLSTTTGDFERANFTIQASNKAFRVLIDGLYSNKHKSVVREIISNAVDAHAAVGTPERPVMAYVAFGSPYSKFVVRDYGPSMSHEQVMTLYTTLFASSKEDTNEQVGYLGLGSKSPFAYTNNFQVTAYTGDTKRIYLAAYDDSDLPFISFIGEVPCTEERGFEVSIPVEHQHRQYFQRELADFALFMPTPPVDDTGKSMARAEPRWKGEGYMFYGSEKLVRQGCVTYPIPLEFCSDICMAEQSRTERYGNGFHITGIIIDVPIGSLEFTASRESLSLTPTTKATLASTIERVQARYRSDVVQLLASSRNMLEAWRNAQRVWAVDHRAILTYKGRNIGKTFHWKDGLSKRSEIYNVMSVNTMNLYRAGRFFPLEDLNRGTYYRFIIDRDEVIPRRKTRLAAAFNADQRTILLHNPPKKALERLYRCLGPEYVRFVPITKLHDQGPTVSAREKSAHPGVNWVTPQGYLHPVKELPEKYVWVQRSGKSLRTLASEVHGELSPGQVAHFWNKIKGLAPEYGDNVLFVTASKAHNYPDEMNLSAVVNSIVDSLAPDLAQFSVWNYLHVEAPMIGTLLRNRLGLSTNKFPNEIIRLYAGRAGVEEEAERLGKIIMSKYPLLCEGSSQSLIEFYADTVDSLTPDADRAILP